MVSEGFRQAAQCPEAWQPKGRVLCRDFGRALISVRWDQDSAELEILVGEVQQPLLPVCSSMLTLAHLQVLLRDYWPTT